MTTAKPRTRPCADCGRDFTIRERQKRCPACNAEHRLPHARRVRSRGIVLVADGEDIRDAQTDAAAEKARRVVAYRKMHESLGRIVWGCVDEPEFAPGEGEVAAEIAELDRLRAVSTSRGRRAAP